jgi:hypothetical protein
MNDYMQWLRYQNLMYLHLFPHMILQELTSIQVFQITTQKSQPMWLHAKWNQTNHPLFLISTKAL